MIYNSERTTIYKSIISNPIQCKLWIQYTPKPLNDNLTIVYIDLTFNHEHHKDAKNSHHPPIIYRCNASLNCWNGRRCWRYCLWQHCYEKFLVFNLTMLSMQHHKCTIFFLGVLRESHHFHQSGHQFPPVPHIVGSQCHWL
jgi:hypothetical protein